MPEAPKQAPIPEPAPPPEIPFPAPPDPAPQTEPAPEAAPAPLPKDKGGEPTPEQSQSSTAGLSAGAKPGEDPAPEQGQSPPRRKKAPVPRSQAPKRKRRRRPSPVPVSMWLLPRFRLPFSTPGEFLRWFLTGINLWAVAAVLLCIFGGYRLVGALSQPRLPGAEQALAGGEATAGLSYQVERTGEGEVTVTGLWDPEAGQDPPSPELAAALCAALSPEEIYGHSSHLYRSIASRFFEGEDFDLIIVLREKDPEKPEEGWKPPEPVFSITRRAGAEDWPQPDCTPDFAQAWRDCYDGYWLFGQGRKEDLGPPQSDPIIEEGDLPPESPPENSEEEAPPLPDLDGESGASEDPGESQPLEGDEPGEPETSEGLDPSSADGSSSSREEPPEETEPPKGLERFFQWVLDQAKKRRADSFGVSS